MSTGEGTSSTPIQQESLTSPSSGTVSTRRPFPVHVNQPPTLKSTSNTEEWEMFKLLYENYAIVSQLDEHPQATQRAIFLSIAGPIAVKLYGSIKFLPTENKNDVQTIIRKIDEQINGTRNETYERYLFNKRDQKTRRIH